jgi:site-specific DNA-methyltransferase (adenine-specific)
MTRTEVIGSATLYLADCRDVLPTLSGVDAVITSPPYNLGNKTGGGFPNVAGRDWDTTPTGKWQRAAIADGYGSHHDNMPWGEYEDWQRATLAALWATLAETGAIFYNHKPRARNKEMWLPLTLNPGLPLRQIVTWARAGGMNYSIRHYVPTYEWIMVFAKPAFRLRDIPASGAGDLWTIFQEANALHPAPFPVELSLRVLETLDRGLALDPFMGSGSTGIAAARRGWKFVGVENHPPYFDIACRRIEQAQRQRDLFIDAPVAEDPADARVADLFAGRGK